MKIRYLLFTLVLCFCSLAQAQNTPNQIMTQAQSSLEQKDYTKARYLFIQAFDGFSQGDDYENAIEAGTQAAYLSYQANSYQEAFALCRQMNQVIMQAEQKFQKSLFKERYMVTKERLEMYIRLKNPEQAQLQLSNMERLVNQANNAELSNDLLHRQAAYFYSFGQMKEGDAAFQKLVTRYKEKKEYEKVSDCYRNLIDIARRSNNTQLMERIYEKFIVWTDSVKALTEQDKLGALQKKYDESLQTIEDKDSSLSIKQWIIGALIVLVLILIGGLVFLGFVLTRFILSNRKLKSVIETTNEHNKQQAEFIQHISTQMEPTMETVVSSAREIHAVAAKQSDEIVTRIQALKVFTNHIQELSALENTLMEPYETASFNVSKFCKQVLEKIKDDVQPGVEISTDIPQSEITSNAEHLEEILLHLLKNAAAYTTSGHIRLELKRKGAHVCQFIITDNGCGIPVEQRETIFKPFTDTRDLSKGDGLGLPICALKAAKLNGSLSIDMEYKKGTRFFLMLQI